MHATTIPTVRLEPLMDHVDKVVVVTLDGAVERQSEISALLGNHGLSFDFHYGRDGRVQSLDSLAKDGTYDPVARAALDRTPLTPPEIGCAVSHRDVAQSLLDSHDRRVLVLEDDVHLVAENLRHLAASIRAMPRDWNLAYLAYAAMNLTTPLSIRLKLLSYDPLAHMLGSSRHEPTAIRRTYRRRLNTHWMHAGWFYGTLAYAIDRSAAAQIVEAQTPVRFESDFVLCHLVRFTRLKAICARYPMFDQRPGVPSVIGARHSQAQA
jgi:glycosyl transferase family 25